MNGVQYWTARCPVFPLLAAALALLACAGPLNSAEIEVVAPRDRSLVRGTVEFQLRPRHEPGERFFENPEVSIQDEQGKELTRFPAYMDARTGICSAKWDTREFRDALYLAEIHYRALNAANNDVSTSEVLYLGLRNGRNRPARFSVELADQHFKLDDGADLTVRVYDRMGKRLPGARVGLSAPGAILDAEAEITDSDGEATVTLSAEGPRTVTLTITVEHLPPVKRTLRFIE